MLRWFFVGRIEIIWSCTIKYCNYLNSCMWLFGFKLIKINYNKKSIFLLIVGIKETENSFKKWYQGGESSCSVKIHCLISPVLCMGDNGSNICYLVLDKLLLHSFISNYFWIIKNMSLYWFFLLLAKTKDTFKQCNNYNHSSIYPAIHLSSINMFVEISLAS